MENVVLIIHLLLALALIGVVLLQRSEGGGLGMGGGSGVMTGRGAATALGKITWGLATAFILTSVALTIVAARNSAGASVLDRIMDAPAPAQATDTGTLDGGSLLPPGSGDAPLVPAPATETPDAAPATETPAEESVLDTTAPAADEAVVVPEEAAPATEAAPETATEPAAEPATDAATETAPADGN